MDAQHARRRTQSRWLLPSFIHADGWKSPNTYNLKHHTGLNTILGIKNTSNLICQKEFHHNKSKPLKFSNNRYVASRNRAMDFEISVPLEESVRYQSKFPDCHNFTVNSAIVIPTFPMFVICPRHTYTVGVNKYWLLITKQIQKLVSYNFSFKIKAQQKSRKDIP